MQSSRPCVVVEVNVMRITRKNNSELISSPHRERRLRLSNDCAEDYSTALLARCGAGTGEDCDVNFRYRQKETEKPMLINSRRMKSTPRFHEASKFKELEPDNLQSPNRSPGLML
jgi:hypothetical protein